jgi:IclR family pca regulon transcriptional regulator
MGGMTSAAAAPADGATGKRLPIASLEKSLRLLEALGRAGESVSVAALIQQTGLERTTVQRIVRTLHAEGYVERTGRGEYAVAPRAYVLGAMLSRSDHLAVLARPILHRLQRATGETVNIAVLDGTTVLCVDHLATDKLLAFNFAVGTRLPAFASSLGRAILAFSPPEFAREVLRQSDRRGLTRTTITSVRKLTAELDRVREQEHALVMGEVEDGLCAVAAPVLGPTGEALAAVNVVVPLARADERRMRGFFTPPLLDATRELSTRLGWPGA